ncbi:MAG TPA: hypothetical protein VI895_01860 [Bdellovibrionota bacterium]|nr:hypothetical protein [Bdellovibrionota bacterium]
MKKKLGSIFMFALISACLEMPAPPSRAEEMGPCQKDADTLCKGVEPGGGRILQCLKKQETLSDSCKVALKGD